MKYLRSAIVNATVFLYLTCNCSAQFIKLFDFDGQRGKEPFGDLLLNGNILYGMTYYGGAKDNGVIFKINPDGTGYDTLISFIGANGKNPFASLISDGTFLYGVTLRGGIKDSGVVFKIKPDGTGYNKLADCPSINFNGKSPNGPLLLNGNVLYGTTALGGINIQPDGEGLVFKMNLDGTGYVDLFDFDSALGSNGRNPVSSVISFDSVLYGMTNQGGTGGNCPTYMGCGVIFKVDTVGTGFAKLLDFGPVNGPNFSGHNPSSSLIFDGTFLYGMTPYGGNGDIGTIFKIKTDGTGDTVLLNFSVTDGIFPYGSLISDGTFLYGMTSRGGANDSGIIFKIKPDGTGYTKLHDFNGFTDGGKPYGSLIFDGDFLYGMTSSGGANGMGTIFKINQKGDGIVENNLERDFKIYPNPSTDKIFIEQSGNTYNEIVLNLYDVFNKKIAQHIMVNAQKAELDVSNLSNGIYFLKINTKDQSFVKKIIIQ